MAKFCIKQTPEDFLVEEVLGYSLSGSGEWVYVFFEKIHHNTIELLQSRTQTLGLAPNTFAVAWLKDKNATTRQWCSFSATLDKETILSTMAKDVTILTVTAHTLPLTVWSHEGNRFRITLATGILSAEEKTLLEQRLIHTESHWFPNFFGRQRFGKGLRNRYRAKEILDHGPEDKRVNHLMLSAFSSLLFNEYAYHFSEQTPEDETLCLTTTQRHSAQLFTYTQAQAHIQGGTLPSTTTIFPTGPMIGRDLILPIQTSPIGRQERDFIRELVTTQQEETLTHYDLKAYRRPLLCHPDDLKRDFRAEDMVLSFTLWVGSFATSLIATLVQGLDKDLPGDLMIPRRPK